MGGTPPSPPQVIMPPETKPEYFQSVIPLESFQDAAGYLGRIEKQLDQAIKDRYRTTGTPAEQAVRSAGTRLQEAASYRSSLPTGDQYLAQGHPQFPFTPAKLAASERLTQAEKEYGEALSRIKEKPAEFQYTGTPSWAQRTIAEGMPGYRESVSAQFKEQKAAEEAKKATPPPAVNPFPFSPTSISTQAQTRWMGTSN